MKLSKKNSVWQEYYNWFFVLILTIMFSFVMSMSYTQGYKQFEDNFFQKKFLVENFNRLRIKLGDHVFSQVLIGKDGWMEYTGDSNLDDFQNASNFSPEALQGAAQTIESCYQYAQEHNITFLMVVAPNKASIYPDKLPEQIQILSSLSRLDQLNNYLRAHNIPEILDLRPALREARQQHDVYYKTNTHWNGNGAYVAYEVIINALSQKHLSLKPYSAKFFRFREVPRDMPHDLVRMIQANFIVEPNLISTRNVDDIVHKVNFSDLSNYHEISWIPNSDLPSLLIFHDSFGNLELNNMLALNFRKAFYIYRGASAIFLNKKTIEQFAPNILIYEVVERNLYTIQYDLSGCASN
jgi:hypothetical protein